MKKIIISLGLCTAVLFASSHSTTFKRKSDDRPKTVNVNGSVIDVREWSKYKDIKIDLMNGKTIKGKIPKHSRIRENDRVRGICSQLKQGRYQNCSLSISRY